MTNAALIKKVATLNERYIKWDKKCGEYWKQSAAQQERAEANLEKVSNQLTELMQSITEEQYNESGIGFDLCADWQDWQ